MTRPPCYNRPPRAEGTWASNGIDPRTGKPRMRWIPRWFVDRCAAWDGTGIGPEGQRYPVANKFDCRDCQWLPDEHQATARMIGITAAMLRPRFMSLTEWARKYGGDPYTPEYQREALENLKRDQIVGTIFMVRRDPKPIPPMMVIEGTPGRSGNMRALFDRGSRL